MAPAATGDAALRPHSRPVVDLRSELQAAQQQMREATEREAAISEPTPY